MRAIVQRTYGSFHDLELRDVAMPVVGDDDVLVRVRAASLHPDVWHVVTGRPYVLRLMGAGLTRPRNAIPGTDMAGTVESVGRNVTRFHPGDAVFGETIRSHMWTNGGALAEFVAVRADRLAAKPDNVTFEQAAAVPTAGYIALLNLRSGLLVRRGARVLINGAGGGVGALAVQIAKANGAHVTAVDIAGKADMLRHLGADAFIDGRKEDFTQAEARFDLIVDIPGNHSLAECRRVLDPQGRYVLIGHEGFGAAGNRVLGLLPRFAGLIGRSLFQRRLRLGGNGVPTPSDSIAMLRDLLEAGKITPVIDSRYPLHEISRAFERMTSGMACGKVIIEVSH